MKGNPSNPFSRDEVATGRDVATPIQKAEVLNVHDHPDEDGYHTARIQVYGESGARHAPIMVPHKGDVTIPERGDDVLVVYGPEDKPWIIGFWYALNRARDDIDTIEIPDYEEGDRIVGNGSGSYVKIAEDGSITIRTDGTAPVTIDHQSASILMSGDFDVAGDDQYYKVPFDDPDDDPENLFTSSNVFEVRNDGQHKIETSIEIPSPGQNNRYQLAIFRNGSEWKRTSRQSAVNEALTLGVGTQKKVNAGDTFAVYLKSNAGSVNTVTSDPAASEFIIQRTGI